MIHQQMLWETLLRNLSACHRLVVTSWLSIKITRCCQVQVSMISLLAIQVSPSQSEAKTTDLRATISQVQANMSRARIKFATKIMPLTSVVALIDPRTIHLRETLTCQCMMEGITISTEAHRSHIPFLKESREILRVTLRGQATTRYLASLQTHLAIQASIRMKNLDTSDWRFFFFYWWSINERYLF